MSVIDTQRLLMEMRGVAQQAQINSASGALSPLGEVSSSTDVGGSDTANGVSTDFASLMRQAVDKVNGLQQASAESKEKLELGDPSVELSDVMIQAQKASLAFQAMSQVRNKLVEAYKDVMNMPI